MKKYYWIRYAFSNYSSTWNGGHIYLEHTELIDIHPLKWLKEILIEKEQIDKLIELQIQYKGKENITVNDEIRNSNYELLDWKRITRKVYKYCYKNDFLDFGNLHSQEKGR